MTYPNRTEIPQGLVCIPAHLGMGVIDPPPVLCKPETTKAPVRPTPEPAAIGTGPVVVKADWGRSETVRGFQNCSLLLKIQEGNSAVPSALDRGSDEMDARDFLEEAADYAAVTSRDRVRQLYEPVAKKCESEIERIMLAALIAVHADVNVYQFMPCPGGRTLEQAQRMCGWIYHFPRYSSATLHSQVLICGYRVDFLFRMHGLNGRTAGFVIECDGHDWHERTKEQAKRDRRQDRDIQAAGLRIMRFTGSEICRDPFKCAQEVWDAFEEFQKEQVAFGETLIAKLDADWGDKK